MEGSHFTKFTSIELVVKSPRGKFGKSPSRQKSATQDTKTTLASPTYQHHPNSLARCNNHRSSLTNHRLHSAPTHHDLYRTRLGFTCHPDKRKPQTRQRISFWKTPFSLPTMLHVQHPPTLVHDLYVSPAQQPHALLRPGCDVALSTAFSNVQKSSTNSSLACASMQALMAFPLQHLERLPDPRRPTPSPSPSPA